MAKTAYALIITKNQTSTVKNVASSLDLLKAQVSNFWSSEENLALSPKVANSTTCHLKSCCSSSSLTTIMNSLNLGSKQRIQLHKGIGLSLYQQISLTTERVPLMGVCMPNIASYLFNSSNVMAKVSVEKPGSN